MRKVSPALLVGLPVFVLALILRFINPLQVWEWKVSDLFFSGREVSDKVLIIAIDDKSLSPESGLGRFKDWPRSYYSQLLRMISANKPAVVAFDLDFRERASGVSDLRLKQMLRESERTNGAPAGDWYAALRKFEADPNGEGLTHPDDIDFQKAIDESGGVVLTSSLVFPAEAKDASAGFPKHSGIIVPIFHSENMTIGFKNIIYDRDGVLRRFMPWVNGMKSFQLAIAEGYAKGTGTDIGEQLLINYAARPGFFKTISFVDILAGRYQTSDVAGKVVLVGGTSRILQDMHPTPTSRNAMSGVEINANIVQQILENKNLGEQGWFSFVFFILIIIGVGSILFFNFSLRGMAILFGAVLLLWPVFGYAMHQVGAVISVIYPELGWIATAGGALWYRNKTELAAKREIKRAFSHYVSPIVVDELAKHPETLRLGGKREKISVMFSDIVGFTTLAEKLSPEDTVTILNDYLSSMTDVVFAYNGTLDKYQGDAIMALFGAPLADEHHPVNVCAAALEMRKALVSLHEKWNQLPNLPFKEDMIKLDFRVGIATGPAIVGNVGSEKRFDYTAIGDIVNLSSRLESVNRKYGTHVIVSKETFAMVTENNNPFLFRKLDTVRVKGKKNPTEIFEVVCFSDTATNDLKTMLDDFENGRILYADRNFAEAKKYFEAGLARVPGDGPAQIYKNRCDFYLRKPPSLDWDAIVDLFEK